MNRSLAHRLDAFCWGRFHTVVTIDQCVGWLLDAFEVTIANNVTGALAMMPWYFRGVEGEGAS